MPGWPPSRGHPATVKREALRTGELSGMQLIDFDRYFMDMSVFLEKL